MSKEEVEKYYDTLSVAQAHRFNALVKVGLMLGKPIEGAYSYAKVIMEKDNDQALPPTN